jgi:putative ABC transport system ATP-binding protein
MEETTVHSGVDPHSGLSSDRKVAVQCRQITKSYGSGDNVVRALRGIDLDIAEGELIMLVGPSGCGKTTLISVIAGVLDRDGGECTVYGQDYEKLNSTERARFRAQNIGFVFQSFNLIPTLSITENVSVPLLIQGEHRHKAMKAAEEMLDRVGLGKRLKDLPQKLSGGQQQRVAIARALVHHPRLVVCDEPTSALDAATGEVVMKLLRQVAVESGRALVVVTHDQRIYRFADRIAVMDDGHIERIVTDAKELQHG